MNMGAIGASVTLAVFGAITGVATGSHARASQTRTVTVTRTAYVRSTTKAAGVRALVSERLAALGTSVTSPRGPYRARPVKIAFDLGGYYGAGTKGLWIDHLKWVDWGQPVAFASGVVHARVWPSDNFIMTAGGIMLDQLRSCGTQSHSYYTYASMLVPAGFPANTESTAYGESEREH